MEFLGYDIGQWIVGVLELMLLAWFIKTMKVMKQNQQILIDELEALRKELNDRKN